MDSILPLSQDLADEQIALGVSFCAKNRLRVCTDPKSFFTELGCDPQEVDRVVQGWSPAFAARLAAHAWRLVRDGYLIPKFDLNVIHNYNYGLFEPTESGKAFFAGHDVEMVAPGSMGNRLRKLKFDSSDPVFHYAQLSHRAFLGGHHEAAAILLGVASESLVERVGTYIRRVGASITTSKLTAAQKAEKRITHARSWFEQSAGDLNKAAPSATWIAELPKRLGLGVTLIRLTRNEHGHPSMVPITGHDLMECLGMFVRFSEVARGFFDFVDGLPLGVVESGETRPARDHSSAALHRTTS